MFGHLVLCSCQRHCRTFADAAVLVFCNCTQELKTRDFVMYSTFQDDSPGSTLKGATAVQRALSGVTQLV